MASRPQTEMRMNILKKQELIIPQARSLLPWESAERWYSWAAAQVNCAPRNHGNIVRHGIHGPQSLPEKTPQLIQFAFGIFRFIKLSTIHRDIRKVLLLPLQIQHLLFKAIFHYEAVGEDLAPLS